MRQDSGRVRSIFVWWGVALLCLKWPILHWRQSIFDVGINTKTGWMLCRRNIHATILKSWVFEIYQKKICKIWRRPLNSFFANGVLFCILMATLRSWQTVKPSLIVGNPWLKTVTTRSCCTAPLYYWNCDAIVLSVFDSRTCWNGMYGIWRLVGICSLHKPINNPRWSNHVGRRTGFHHCTRELTRVVTTISTCCSWGCKMFRSRVM